MDMAEKEDNCIVSVGGLATKLRQETIFVFSFYDKSGHLMWQMAVPTDNPKEQSQVLLDKYNELNEWIMDRDEAVHVEFCNLDGFVKALKNRGKEYIQE